MSRRTFTLLALAGRGRLCSLGFGRSLGLGQGLAGRSGITFGLATTELVPDDSELVPRVLRGLDVGNTRDLLPVGLHGMSE